MIHWLNQSCEWMRRHANDVYSQFGEDGLIAAVFRRVGTENAWAFECGASDGVTYSNTKLLEERGWQCLLMEVDPRFEADLERNRPKAAHRIDRLGPGGLTLDEALAGFRAPEDIDLVVVDIDGQDYWAVGGMIKYRPRVLMVEYECPDKDSPPPPVGGYGQAGSTAIHTLLESKGYTVVVRTDCNAIAVRTELFARLI